MQVSRSPTARCTSTAATENRRRRRARRSRAVGPDQLANPRDLALDEVARRPVRACSRRPRTGSCGGSPRPAACAPPRDGTARRRAAAAACSNAAIGELSLRGGDRRSRAAARRRGRRGSSRPGFLRLRRSPLNSRPPSTVTLARPYSRRVGPGRRCRPERWASELHAVAEAEHRGAELEQRAGRRWARSRRRPSWARPRE